MSSRTARWAAQVPPGPPAPRTRAPSVGPASTVYPESSVSNPNASRYTGRSSRARSASISHPPTQHQSYYTSSSSSSPRASSSRSSRATSPTSVPIYHASSGQPVIARTSDSRGRTGSYVILPPPGHKVEIVHPTPIRPSSTTPYSSSSYYSSSSPPKKDKPLLRRLLDKVDWGSSKNSRRSSSVSHSSTPNYNGSRARRNSTGDANGWTAIPAGDYAARSNHGSGRSSRRSVDSGARGTVTTVTSGGRRINIIHV